MILIVLLILIVMLFISERHQRSVVSLKGGNIKTESDKVKISNLSHFENINDNDIKSIYVFTHMENDKETINGIIEKALKKADVMLISDYDIPDLDKKNKEDRIIISKNLPKTKYEKCIKTLTETQKDIIDNKNHDSITDCLVRTFDTDHGTIIIYKNQEDANKIIELLSKKYTKTDYTDTVPKDIIKKLVPEY